MSLFDSEQGNVTRLLVITQFFPPESMGGAHRWKKLSENLSDDIEVRVLCPPPTFPYGEFERDWSPYTKGEENGIPVTRLWTWQPKKDDSAIGRILNYGVFAVLATFYVLLNWWRFDSVVTMSAPHTTYLPGVVAKLTGRKWIVDIFDLWLDNAADLGYVDEKSPVYRLVGKLESVSMYWSDHVFVITETMSEYYQQKYPKIENGKIEVIPFGVNTKLFSPDLNVDRDGPDIIYTGNLGTGQAFKPFLKAFAGLDADVTLEIVGHGERREELEDLVESYGVSDRVTFVGLVPREEIPKRLASSKVSLVPLKTEYNLDYARPNKLLESMAVGTPYVASGVKEIELVTELSQAGVSTDNQPELLEKEMRLLVENNDIVDEMSKRGPKFIEESHSWDQLGIEVSEQLKR